MRKPRVLILLAPGTNRHLDGARAFQEAGADTEVVPLAWLRQGRRNLKDYQILLVPGGFSYADSLGAGRLLGLDLQSVFADQVAEHVAAKKPVLGICNGFQALVRSGLLPGALTFNQGGHFECRWVRLRPSSQRCIWTRGLEEPIECPVAHGEGNFQSDQVGELAQADQLALLYERADRGPLEGRRGDREGLPCTYPANPNGSIRGIAGICDHGGTVLGLMPHPEDHLMPYQHPQRRAAHSGIALFQRGVAYAAQL